MSTLEKLKQKLNFTGASKGLESVDAAAKGVNFSGLSNGVEAVRAKFSALEVMGVTALANITNSAVNAGKRITSALTIDPIKTGFQEYETQINAVQTILANTKSKGTDINDVNKALDTLNTYADKTIYNFTEMTRNIGTFTAAGVDLDTSVKSIQGIANLAAVSGSSSQQASTAMYQLSQALAAGKVSLMDWNSVVNAGMGGEVFQNALKRTATNLGTNVDAMIKKYGSFRESLTQGEWLTTEVLTKTLEQFTMSAEKGSKEWEKFKKSLMEEGYTEKQAEEILDMANTATEAATKVKTFTQLWDTLKEAAQSGWTQTWEIIIGDFEEAKNTLTKVSDTLNEMIGKTADARNALLQGWKDDGGRTDLIESLSNAFKFLLSVIEPVKEAFREVFPALKVEHLTAFTKGLKNFTENLKLSDDASDKLKRTFKGVFSIFEIFRKAIVIVGKAIGDLFKSEGVSKLGTFLLDITATIGDFFTSINEGFDSKGLTGFLSSIVGGISELLGTAVTHIDSFSDLLAAAGDVVANVAGKIWETLKKVAEWFSETFSAGDIFAGLAGGGIFVASKKISGFLDNIIDAIKGIFGGGEDGESIKDKIGDILGSVKDSLTAFTTGIKISSLVSIAIAIGILSAALKTISKIETGNIIKSLSAIGVMMAMLGITMTSLSKSMDWYGNDGLVKAGVSLVLIATSLTILAKAVEKMSKLSFPELVKGLVGVGGGMVVLAGGIKAIAGVKIPLSTSVAMLALAASCSILGDALKKYNEMSWDEMKRGLSAMGGALAEFVVAMGLLNKFGGVKSMFGSVGILIAAQALDEIADALKKFGAMSWDEIKRGLASMGGAIGELTIALSATGKIAGFSSIFAAGSISIVVNGLDEMATALKSFGEMSWDEIKKGLTSMGGALAEVAIATGSVGKIAGVSSLFAAGGIFIVIQGLADMANAMKSFGGMSWEEIKLGLTGMGGALAEVAIVTGGLGKLAGFSGLFGSGAILLTVQGLGDLAEAMKVFGGMSWDEIKRGLTGMGGALAEVAIVSGGLGALTGIAGIIGSGSLLIAVQGLGDLADSLKKFGEMSWDEIQRGLSAMGGALGETALGGLLNTLSGIGALAISEMASSLGVLADSVKKWSGVTVPENLGVQLGLLATGVEKFTLAGMGSGALATAAPAVGILADSVKKWKDVTVPEGIGGKLESLANGVKKFTWAGMGAGALADAAPAIGTLATSVKKWKDVTVPENLGTDMTTLANGVKSFSFAFAGGWSMSALVKPLGDLPASISKWKDVSVPEGIEANLKSVANGVKAFSFAFAGGWSISAIVTPLGDLAGSISKWSNVTIPEGLGSGLKSVANGVAPFAQVGDISYVGDYLSKMVTPIKNLSTIGYDTISSGLRNLSDAISKLATTKSMGSVGNTIVKSLIEPIEKSTSKFSDAGTKLMSGLEGGVLKGRIKLLAGSTKMISEMLKSLDSSKPKFKVAGIEIISNFINGIISQKARASASMVSTISSSVTNIRSLYPSFYNSGAYLVSGFANGISSNTYKAAAKARAMASAAAQAARTELDEHSPSRVGYEIGDFFGVAFVNAIGEYADKAYRVSSDVAASARVGLSDALNRINDCINSDMDTQPTIRPVVDLSELKASTSAISSLFGDTGVGVMANVGAVNSMMNSRSQNGANDDVVSAIDKLRKDFNDMDHASYTIGGITYGEGTEVANAIKTLVHAAKRERRV
jgi:tape measure domain-containing protein